MYGQSKVKTESRTLSASCIFHFGKLSDFESNYCRYKAENDQLAWWYELGTLAIQFDSMTSLTGSYFLTISTSNQTKTEKIIINK